MDKLLSYRQKIFVDAYLKTRNATEAARIAGYSPKTARQIGHENLTKPDIRDAVNNGMTAYAKELELTPEGIKAAIQQVASHAKKDSDKLRALELLGKATPGTFEPAVQTHPQVNFLTIMEKFNLNPSPRKDGVGKDGATLL